jgi:hypothetical protein
MIPSRAHVPLGLVLVALLGSTIHAGRMPGPSEISVGFEEGAVTLNTEDANRGMILRRLARVSGFQVIVSGAQMQKMTLHLEGVSREDALGRILEGVPYSLRYELDRQGEHALALAIVGEFDSEQGRLQRARALMQWRGQRARAARRRPSPR